jgi:uncharacterized protein YdgA (DUF945 family)
MKKTIVAVVFLILVGALAVPFASGVLMERAVRGAFQEMNARYKDLGTGFSLAIMDYDRRYLTSDIEWKIDLGPLAAISQVDEVVFKDHAQHGFTGVVSTTSLKNNPWYADFVANQLKGNDPVHITTQYGISGSIKSTVVLDAFSVLVEGEKIDVKGADLFTTTDRKLANFNSTGTWEGISVGDGMAFGKTSMASKLRMFSPYIWDGDVHFEVQGVEVEDKGGQFKLEKLKATHLFKVNDDRTRTAMEYQFSIEGMNAKDKRVDNAFARFAIEGIDVEAYESVMQMYTQSMSQLLGDMRANDGDSGSAVKHRMNKLGFQMMAAYEKLLKKGLELKISDLNIKMADGEINGGLSLRLLKDMTLMQFAPIAGQPELMFDIIYLKSDFSLPVTLVGDNPKLEAPIFPGMQTGLFVKKGDHLVHQAETVDGKFILNSNEVILPGQEEIQPTSSAHQNG